MPQAALVWGQKRSDMFWSITKAYTTRVGTGPFPTEQLNEDGETLDGVATNLEQQLDENAGADGSML